jgi:hypothetical protein
VHSSAQFLDISVICLVHSNTLKINFSTSDSSDASDDENDDTTLQDQISGFRLVDIHILNRNVMSQVVCAFCNGAVQLCKVERRGLRSKLNVSLYQYTLHQTNTLPYMPNDSSWPEPGSLFCELAIHFRWWTLERT